MKKFLFIPSLMAGVCLGLNNFLLGLISQLGISAAPIFSFGAFVFCSLWKSKQLIQKWVQGEKLFEEFSWVKVGLLLLRTVLNLLFQLSIIIGFHLARQAQLNQGIITALFGSYCIITPMIFSKVFKETLEKKFQLGIVLILICIVCVTLPK